MTSAAVTNLDREIEKAKTAHAAKLKKLKRAAAAEQQRLDERVLAILREQHPESYAQLARQAADDLAAEKTERARRARQARETGKAARSSAYGQATPAGGSEEAGS